MPSLAGTVSPAATKVNYIFVQKKFLSTTKSVIHITCSLIGILGAKTEAGLKGSVGTNI